MRVVQAEEPQYEDDGSLHARLRHPATVPNDDAKMIPESTTSNL